MDKKWIIALASLILLFALGLEIFTNFFVPLVDIKSFSVPELESEITKIYSLYKDEKKIGIYVYKIKKVNEEQGLRVYQMISETSVTLDNKIAEIQS